MKAMNTAADEVCEVMRLLTNQSRLRILCLLAEGEKTVGRLVAELGAREPAVSQQLAILRGRGIVRARRDGKSMIYSMVDPQVGKLLETLHGIYCGQKTKTKEN